MKIAYKAIFLKNIMAGISIPELFQGVVTCTQEDPYEPEYEFEINGRTFDFSNYIEDGEYEFPEDEVLRFYDVEYGEFLFIARANEKKDLNEYFKEFLQKELKATTDVNAKGMINGFLKSIK